MITYDEILQTLTNKNLVPEKLSRVILNKTRTGYETITTGIMFHAPSICKDTYLEETVKLFHGEDLRVFYDTIGEMVNIEIPIKEIV